MDYNILSPYVRFALYSVIEPPFTVGWRIIFDYELIFVDGGGCRLTINGTEYLCKKRRCHLHKAECRAPL